jgi:TP901 family phage tail tape measure protein
MALIGNLVMNLKANTAQFSRSMRKARTNIQRFRATTSFLNRGIGQLLTSGFSAFGHGLRTLTRFVGGLISKLKMMIKLIGTALVAALGYAIVKAAAFQKQMAMVSTMLTEKTMPMMGAFTKGIDYLSKQFGESTETLSKGLYDILSASIDSSRALGVLAVSSKAAIAGLTETAVSADAITTIINSYKMSAEDAEAVSDKLFATVKFGKITFEELAQNIGVVSSSASIAGLKLEELLAAIATSTRAGLRADQAITGLSSAVNTFIKPSEGATKAAKKIGLELSSNTLRTMGLIGAVKKLNKLNVDQLGQIVENVRAFRAFAAVIQDVEGYEKNLAFISEKYAGEMGIAFGKMANTTVFRFKQLKQSIISLARSIGDQLLPYVNKLLAGFNNWLTSGGAEKIAAGFEKIIITIQKWYNLLTTDFGTALRGMAYMFKAVLQTMANMAILWGKYIAREIQHALSFEFQRRVAMRVGLVEMERQGRSEEYIQEALKRVGRMYEGESRRTAREQGIAPPVDETGKLMRDMIKELQSINKNTNPIPVGAMN